MKSTNLPKIQKKIYNDYVKYMVDNDRYFHDSLNYYLDNYITPKCEKFILAFILLFTLPISYFLVSEVIRSLPIKEPFPIIIKANADVNKFPIIKSLRKNYDDKTIMIDDAISRYLAETYIKERESFDFRNGDAREINRKLEYIRNNSSSKEYQKFKNFIDRSNENSPIKYFGTNVYSEIEVIKVSLKKPEKSDIINLAKDFINNKMSTEYIIIYDKIQYRGTKSNKQRIRAKISFSFSGIHSQFGELREILDFTVNDFEIY